MKRFSNCLKNRLSSLGLVLSNLGAARSPGDGIVVEFDITATFVVVVGIVDIKFGIGICNGNGEGKGVVSKRDSGSEILVGEDSVLDDGCELA